VKYVPDLKVFVEKEVKEETEKIRKDIPLFNFIHENSGP
jgi:hypothetical protein